MNNITTGDIYNFIDKFAPFKSAMDFDNPGLLVGDYNTLIKRVLITLDITNDVVDEAVNTHAQLIISHHPVIFNPIKKLNSSSAVYRLVNNSLTAICAHTNLDMAEFGVNTVLANTLRLQNVKPLQFYKENLAEGLMGQLKENMTSEKFAEFVKEVLHCGGLRYVKGSKIISKVGLCSGGGADLLYKAAEMGCDAYVTGESKHNQLLDAKDLGLTFIDAGHYSTEHIIVFPLKEKLQKAFPQVEFAVSQKDINPVQFI